MRLVPLRVADLVVEEFVHEKIHRGEIQAMILILSANRQLDCGPHPRSELGDGFPDGLSVLFREESAMTPDCRRRGAGTFGSRRREPSPPVR